MHKNRFYNHELLLIFALNIPASYVIKHFERFTKGPTGGREMSRSVNSQVIIVLHGS